MACHESGPSGQNIRLTEDVAHGTATGRLRSEADVGPLGEVLQIEAHVVGLCERIEIDIVEPEQVKGGERPKVCHLYRPVRLLQRRGLGLRREVGRVRARVAPCACVRGAFLLSVVDFSPRCRLHTQIQVGLSPPLSALALSLSVCNSFSRKETKKSLLHSGPTMGRPDTTVRTHSLLTQSAGPTPLRQGRAHTPAHSPNRCGALEGYMTRCADSRPIAISRRRSHNHIYTSGRLLRGRGQSLPHGSVLSVYRAHCICTTAVQKVLTSYHL